MPQESHVIFAHIVTFNSAHCILKCIDSLLQQKGCEIGRTLNICVTDNASGDCTAALIKENFSKEVFLRESKFNLGFCGGHNLGVADFLKSDAAYLLIMNPDLKLGPEALALMAGALNQDSSCGCACPKLYRADAKLEGIKPLEFDSTGMLLTNSLRHFDRGSGEPEQGQYDRQEYVFGASGACMLLKREFVKDMLIDDGEYSDLPSRIFPVLACGRSERAQLFDEAFFAYREDADLAWRAEGTKWRFLYVPEAAGYHTRVVLPERREKLDPALNLHSVRNRFLLQVNNYSFMRRPGALIPGVLFRNLLVLLGVLLRERSSLPGVWQFFRLFRRSLYIRAGNKARRNSVI